MAAEDWSRSIREKIPGIVSKHRVARELFGKVGEDMDPNEIGETWVKGGPDTEDISERGERITVLATPKFERVAVSPISIKVQGNSASWFQGRYPFGDYFLDNIGRRVAAQETTKLVRDLVDKAREVKTFGSQLKKSDVNEAAAWIRSNGHVPDTLLVHPRRTVELVSRSEIRQKWDLPQSLWDKKGLPFVGFMDDIDIYWVAEMPLEMCLLYEKSETHAQIGKVETKFGYVPEPSFLVTEKCLAWAYNANALAKVGLTK
jgi:hypothetical protein